MKILIIGNGFDLAHGLPTRYTDFLNNTKKFFEYHKNVTLNNEFGLFFSNKLKKYDLYSEFCAFEGNAWFLYLLDKQKEKELRGDTWVDFEYEIRMWFQTLSR